MATSNVSVTQGSGKNAATYSFTEDAITKDVARAVLSTPGGTDINPANPLSISWIGSTAATVGQKAMASSVPIVMASDQSTMTVVFDPGHEIGTIRGNTNTLTIFIPDTGHELGTIRGNTNTLTVFLPDTGHELGSIRGNTNTLTVFLPDTGHELGTIRGNTNTLTVFLPDTGHEIGTIRGNTNTLTVQFSPSTPAVLANTSATIVIPLTASGTASGVSVSGNTIIAPTTGRSFKVYAYSITTTAISSVVARFTNGAGTSPTEFWRIALQSPSAVASGANLAIQPPGYLFATGVTTTLAILLDAGIIFHYSVAYYEESA